MIGRARMRLVAGLAVGALALGGWAGVPLHAGSAAQAREAAAAQVALAGTVAVVGGSVDLSTLTARVNGEPVTIGADGSVRGAVTPATYYQVAIAGDGVFASVHSFGTGEVRQADGTIQLPRIEVVARAPGRVELFFGGDVMIGRRYEEPIFGGRALVNPGSRKADMARLFEPMRPYFATADMASVNLETVLATDTPGDAPDKSVVFYTHSDAAAAIAESGIDFVTLGNNHSYDYLDAGLATTLAAIDGAKLAHSGAGVNAEAALKAARLSVGGNPYAMLGFVGWKGTVEPNQIAEANKGGAAYGTDENIRDTVRREVAAAQLPIVQYHGSSEYSARPTEISERRMKLAIDSGAVLVVSHHPHVPQGLELYKGRLIAYSLGNFVFDQYFPETHGTIALKVWMDGDKFFRAEVIPVQMLDYRPVPAVGNFRAAVLRRVAALSAERGTYLALSGGHGVITPESATAPGQGSICNAGAVPGITPIPFAVDAPLDLQAACPASTAKRVWGTDILIRGDFENAHYGDAIDRSWAVAGAEFLLGGPAHGGRIAMRLKGEGADKPMLVAPQTFFRPTDAGRYTLTGWIRTATPVKLEASVQAQPRGANRFDALKGAPVARIGVADTGGDGAWKQFRFDFPVPRDDKGKALPMRPLLRIVGAEEVSLDDVALIAWEDPATPPPTSERAMRTHVLVGE